MQGKIGLEEHFAIDDTLHDSKGFLADSTWPELESRLMDMQERRIAEMDRHGMQTMILSLNAPAIQSIPDAKRASDMAPGADDFFAGGGGEGAWRVGGGAGRAGEGPG